MDSIFLSVLGLGTATNVAAVLVVGGIRTLAGARFPEGMRVTTMWAVGIVTLLVGVANLLRFATTSTQIVPTLTLATVR